MPERVSRIIQLNAGSAPPAIVIKVYIGPCMHLTPDLRLVVSQLQPSQSSFKLHIPISVLAVCHAPTKCHHFLSILLFNIGVNVVSDLIINYTGG